MNLRQRTIAAIAQAPTADAISAIYDADWDALARIGVQNMAAIKLAARMRLLEIEPTDCEPWSVERTLASFNDLFPNGKAE